MVYPSPLAGSIDPDLEMATTSDTNSARAQARGIAAEADSDAGPGVSTAASNDGTSLASGEPACLGVCPCTDKFQQTACASEKTCRVLSSLKEGEITQFHHTEPYMLLTFCHHAIAVEIGNRF